MRVNGFYGHVRRNDWRSVALFLGFLLAYQMLASLVLLLPLAFLDPGHVPFAQWAAYAQRYVPVVLVGSIVVFLIQFARRTRVVQVLTGYDLTDRIRHPRLVQAIEIQALAAGVRYPQAGIIDSPARTAFTSGVTARSATIVVTRGLLEALDDRELAAVIAHEIVLIRNGDVTLMTAAHVFVAGIAGLAQLNPVRDRGGHAFSDFAIRISQVSRAVISSARHYVADAEAVRLTHDPGALVSALQKIDGHSIRFGLPAELNGMMLDGPAEGPNAMHPPIAKRIAALRRLSGNMMAPVPDDPRPSLRERAMAVWNWKAFGLSNGFGPAVMLSLPALVVMGWWKFSGLEQQFSGTFAVNGQTGVMTRSEANPATSTPQAARPAPPPKPTPHDALLRTAAASPVEARCFWTEPYRPGDLGHHPVQRPDPALVARYSTPQGSASADVVLERYLGQKAYSVAITTSAKPAELDQMLLDYVRARKLLTKLVHRYFEEAGMSFLVSAYDTEADRAILDTLRRRVAEGAPALTADQRIAGEIALLLAAPGAFVPCISKTL